MNKRIFLTILLMSGIILFGLISFATLYGYALPRPNIVNLGPVSHFPPVEAPYFVRGEKPVFVVNTGEKILVLVPVPPHPKSCFAKWFVKGNKFMEPCLGSQFQLDGTYILGPSPRSMDQYEFTIINGDLWVNFDRKILGEEHN